MREQLIQYVELLFAGAPNSMEIKQEILQNTLDRYDDLVQQGKSPEAAYRLAISGIGDINEILGSEIPYSAPPAHEETNRAAIHEEAEDIRSRNIRAVAVALYILCPVPLFLMSELGWETFGLCLTLLVVAAATMLIMMAKKKGAHENEFQETPSQSPKQELRRSIQRAVNAIILAIYLIVSFATGAWYATWLLFPIGGCIKGLVNAILDLKEAHDYEA